MRFLAFYPRASRLEQLDHSWNSSRSSLSSGRSFGTIRPLTRFLVFYHRAGRLEQLDHSWNSSHSSSPSGKSPGTTIPLTRFLAFHHWAGRLEQLDHFWKSSHSFYHRAGRLEQLDHFLQKKKTKRKKSKRKEVEGLSRFFLYKLTIQIQKKMNFPMPLHHNYCKEGIIVIIQFWSICF